MPRRYEKIRDRLIEEEGLSRAQAERKAARIHNATKKPGEKHAGRQKGGKK